MSPVKQTSDKTYLGNILIADPDRNVSRNLKEFFSNEGFGVYECSSVVGLMKLEHENLRLILIDINIDNNNGIQAIELIRQSKAGANIPIIICSDIPSTDDIIRGLNAGADDYLLKPYSTRELLARVHALLRRAS